MTGCEEKDSEAYIEFEGNEISDLHDIDDSPETVDR
jgi:hypothetical protein